MGPAISSDTVEHEMHDACLDTQSSILMQQPTTPACFPPTPSPTAGALCNFELASSVTLSMYPRQVRLSALHEKTCDDSDDDLAQTEEPVSSHLMRRAAICVKNTFVEVQDV